MRRILPLLLAACFLLTASLASAEPTLKALIVDGQNNHGVWPKTTQKMKKYLEETGLFTVDFATTAKNWTDQNFKPDLKSYNGVCNN